MTTKSPSKYNGVTYDKDFKDIQDFDIEKPWKVYIRHKRLIRHVSHHSTEREAAIQADKVYISLGLLKKVNILKPKS